MPEYRISINGERATIFTDQFIADAFDEDEAREIGFSALDDAGITLGTWNVSAELVDDE